jgi:hypothetical protein
VRRVCLFSLLLCCVEYRAQSCALSVGSQDEAAAFSAGGCAACQAPGHAAIHSCSGGNPKRVFCSAEASLGGVSQSGGFNFDGELAQGEQRRDVFLKGYCDAGVKKLAELAGWDKDLEALICKGFKGKKSPDAAAPGDAKSEAKGGDSFMSSLKSAVDSGEKEFAAGGAKPAESAGSAASTPVKAAAVGSASAGSPAAAVAATAVSPAAAADAAKL